MSGNVQTSSFSAANYLEIANNIRNANQENLQHMQHLYEELVIKAQEYHNQLLISDRKVDAMKTVIAKQCYEIKSMHQKMNEMSRRLQIAETTSQLYANKYNRIFNQMKSIILESECDDEVTV